MTDDIRALLDEAVLLLRAAGDVLEIEGRHVLPVNMRKLADDMDKELAK